MDTLQSLFPTAEQLLAVPPEDLAPTLLKLAAARLQPGGFIPEAVTEAPVGALASGTGAIASNGYSIYKKNQIDTHLSRAWGYLEREGFIEPTLGINGRNGWRQLTDNGQAVAAGQDFGQLREALEFPKSILHPAIRERVWLALMRGRPEDFAEAVRFAFVAVEDAVRDVAPQFSGEYGKELTRKAFSPENGPLTDATRPMAEREGMSHFFAGAMMAFRNPHSHRSVIADRREAQDQVTLASHLLRIVDARRPK